MTSSTGTAAKTSSATITETSRTTAPQPFNSRQQTLRTGPTGGGYVGGATRQYPRHLLAYSLISMLVVLCWLPDFIAALKDVSVTIPQAVKRGSNAMLTCNYDMENDTLYSVKWYKGRREFYRYTPKENPAMKVFLTQSGLNVERNLSNQSHVVLLAVPLNISGKFTCEISVEAPSFQTAMVSGEMEVVELPDEQASVTGIQPRYRIGDLVDGNCSIKYSKPAANLTWTINGIVVPPHHIKTYQIEKYEETNLESVMSAIHFMVTTQHFIKGQMRLKCTASIFDIFKEEIESIIEEDRPRIMASGRSYDTHSYPHDHDNGGGYEDHNESYLTYFSAPKSSASPTARAPFAAIFQQFHKLLQHLPTLSLLSIKTRICFTLTTFIIDIERYYEKITQSDMTTYCMKLLQQQQCQLQQLIKLITVMAVLLKIHQQRKGEWRWCWWRQSAAVAATLAGNEMATNNAIKKKSCNCKGHMRKVQEPRWNVRETTTNTLLNSYRDMQYQQRQLLQELATHSEHCYLCEQEDEADTDVVAATAAADCQLGNEQCLAANQNVINEKVLHQHTNKKLTKASSTATITIASDCQQHMSQTLDGAPSPTSTASLATSSSSPTAVVSTGAYVEPAYAHDSFPLCEDAFGATESNNANCMSKDQTLLMTSTTNAIPSSPNRTSALQSTTKRAAPSSSSSPYTSAPTSSLSSSPSSSSLEAFSSFSLNNNCLMAFIGELLLHQC